MASNDKKRGFVYAVVNPEYLHLVKIGNTGSQDSQVKDLKERLKELSRHAGVPDDFMLYYAVETRDCEAAEALLHKAFSKDRHKRTEFFKIEYSQAEAAMSPHRTRRESTGLAKYIETERRKIEKAKERKERERKSEEEDNHLDSSLKTARRKRPVSRGAFHKVEKEHQTSGVKRKARPNIDMRDLGIPNGAELTFKKDRTIKAKAVLPQKIRFQGEEMLLTSAARIAFAKIGNPDRKGYSGAYYWEYKGETLMDIRNRLESKSKERVMPKLNSRNPQRSGGENQKKPNTDMLDLGIPIGADLTFQRDSAIKAKVVGAQEVRFQGEVISLSTAARRAFEKIGGPKWASYAGAQYWEYKGETLKKIRDRLELKNQKLPDDSQNRQHTSTKKSSKKRVMPKSKRVNTQHSDGKGVKKSNTDMLDLGIPVGAELTFKKDRAIKAKVVGAQEVRFQGEVMKLSTAAKKALETIGIKWKSCAGANFWEYKGETLKEIRDRLESK